jgi:hypothetical protein
MRETELSARLAGELRAVPPTYVTRRLLLAAVMGFVGSLALVGLGLGFRPDMGHALSTPMFWSKLVYVLALAAVGLWTAERLGRPAETGRRRAVWVAAPLGLVALIALVRWLQAPAPLREHMVMGDSASVCPWLILISAIPPLAGMVWALRGLAPTRPILAGAAAGLSAGGIGAAAYCLHCPESGMPFLAIWYTTGIAATAIAGAAAGARLLRW